MIVFFPIRLLPSPTTAKESKLARHPASTIRLTLWLWLCLSSLCACDLGPKDPAGSRPFVVRARPVASPLADHSAFRAGFELSTRHLPFGGFSGLIIEGDQLLAISDSGFIWQSRLVLDQEGVLLGFTDSKFGSLHDAEGNPASRERRLDAEELSRWDDGWLVSFEGDHKILSYRAAGHPALSDPRPRPVELPEQALGLRKNGGLEAMTELADGRLLLIAEDGPLDPESPTADDRTLPAWVGRLQPDSDTTGQIACSWQKLNLEKVGEFHPTGAASLPSGDVLLLERSWNEIDGVRARLSVLSASDLQPGVQIRRYRALDLNDSSTIDNFEAVYATPGAHGSTWVYLLSDNNFSDAQRTLLHQFLLPTAETSPNVTGAR